MEVLDTNRLELGWHNYTLRHPSSFDMLLNMKAVNYPLDGILLFGGKDIKGSYSN